MSGHASDTLNEQQLYDYGIYRLRQLAARTRIAAPDLQPSPLVAASPPSTRISAAVM
jgi:hypothetical protein